MAKKKEILTTEEKLEKALVPDWEQPYKVPGNWVWTRLETPYKFIDYRGKTPCKIASGIPLITAKNVRKGYIDYKNAEFISESEFLTRQSRGISKKGDILFTTEAPLGNVAIADLEVFSTGQRLITLQNKAEEKQIKNKFLFFYMLSYYFQKDLENSKTGTTVAGIKAEKLKTIALPLPPLAEQKRIVERIESLFSKLDEAKELAQSALDSFDNRKSAILHNAFTGELTKKWREENGVGLERWEETVLGKACTVNPKRINVKEYDDELVVTFVPMTSVSDINGTIDNPLTEKLLKVKKGYTNFSENDVIFAKITPCMENGKSAVVGKLKNNIGFGSTEFHVLRCDDKTNNRYIYHLVRWQKFRDEAKSVMTGAVGQQRVPKQFLEEYVLNLPTLPEQKEIVRILDSIFEKETKAKGCANVIMQINLMKKAILARAFRGELGTNDESDESAMELLKEILGVE